MVSLNALMSVLAAATAVTANSLSFINQDSTIRTIHFKSNPGHYVPDPIVIAGLETTSIDMPSDWQGMFYSVSEGVEDPGKGMLGEVTFNTAMSITFFDVSAIDAPEDHDGVKLMYPRNYDNKPFSGCQDQKFPCDNVYINPWDVQTKATPDIDIVTLLGNKAGLKKRGGPSARAANAEFENFGRDVLVEAPVEEEA